MSPAPGEELAFFDGERARLLRWVAPDGDRAGHWRADPEPLADPGLARRLGAALVAVHEIAAPWAAPGTPAAEIVAQVRRVIRPKAERPAR
jgi:hypothetical protein